MYISNSNFPNPISKDVTVAAAAAALFNSIIPVNWKEEKKYLDKNYMVIHVKWI
jgi:hypothetical protein